MSGLLHWRAPLHPVVAAAILLGLGVWLLVLYRRQRAKHPRRRAAALVLPKAALAALLMLACFDPVWKVVDQPDESQKLAVVLDVSGSMEVVDTQDLSRVARAEVLLSDLERRIGRGIACEVYEFDQEMRRRDKERHQDGPLRQTDLGTCLVTLASDPAIAGHVGVVILTDGGDEPVQNVRLPEMPVYVAGMGSDPDGWDDVAIAEVDAPSVVERESEFTVDVEVVVRRASGSFATGTTGAEIVLEESTAQGWVARESRRIDLQAARQRIEFAAKSPAEEGIRDYRVRVQTLPGELSALNNVRMVPVEVGKDQLPVLLFAQEIGWDFGTVRKELARDPSLALTSLFRISEDRFVIQDSRQEGDAVLEAGFPSEVEVLNLYKCIVVGSFPASQWEPAQMEALMEYVRQGGAVIFMGGVASYAQGGYARSIIEPLFPWTLEGSRGGFQTGAFPVHIPVSAVNHEIMAGVHAALAGDADATVNSLTPVGALRAGAVTLLEAGAGSERLPVAAVHRYGEGHCLAIATDTLWRWTRASESRRTAFRHFWRQAVRAISQWAEGEQFLSVRWDRPTYRPGERATVNVDVSGRHEQGQVHLKAALEGSGGPTDLNVQSVLGSTNAFTTSVPFPERGEYTFRLEALVAGELLEAYEKVLRVGPSLNEGARLEVDHAFLDHLASQSGGAHFREDEFGDLVDLLRSRAVEQAVTIDMPLVEYRYVFLLLLLVVLAAEWTIRRRMNLF